MVGAQRNLRGLRTLVLVVTPEQVTAALAGVQDPEIRRPITELGMVKGVEVGPDGAVTRRGLPDRRRLPDAGHITRDVTAAVGAAARA